MGGMQRGILFAEALRGMEIKNLDLQMPVKLVPFEQAFPGAKTSEA
jgi:hypothetical protein